MPPMIGKGLENLKKAYGQLGYINFGAIPKPSYDDQKKTVSMDIDIDEGKQFYVSRIEFQGNTITRDRVIRRELMLDEGSVYNSQLWEYSLLRLNQLEYFEPLKVDQDSEAHQDADAGTVELLLKVKEKGKNSIGMNGGVSGLSGAFIGVNYQTNNFLGLGETLSLQGNLGSISRQFLFGFTQPYIRNRPINVGFQIFNQKQDYNAAKNYQTTAGASANLTAAQQSLTQNYNQASDGMNFSLSYPLKRHAFQRVGFTYSWTRSTITAFSTASQTFFQTIAFRSGIQGSNPLAGIINSSVSFSYTYNTISNPHAPAHRQGVYGRVSDLRPVGQRALHLAVRGLQALHPHALPGSHRPTAAMCWQCARSWVTCRASAAMWLRPTTASTPAAKRNCAASMCAAPRPTAMCPRASTSSSPIPTAPACRAIPTNPEDNQCIQVPLPIYGIASIGGDTNLITNAEYRIPIVGPVHVLVLRRLRHRRGPQPWPVEAEPRRLRLAHSRRFTAARSSTTAPAKAAFRLRGWLPARHPAHRRYQLRSPHVHRRASCA